MSRKRPGRRSRHAADRPRADLRKIGVFAASFLITLMIMAAIGALIIADEASTAAGSGRAEPVFSPASEGVWGFRVSLLGGSAVVDLGFFRDLGLSAEAFFEGMAPPGARLCAKALGAAAGALAKFASMLSEGVTALKNMPAGS